MISTPDRRRIITLINAAVAAVARLLKACDVLKLSMRTIQRWRLYNGTVRVDSRPTAWRPTPSNKLSDDERVRIVQTINQPEFANLPPGVIVPMPADRELFIGSESTIHRAMKVAKQFCHRGKARRPSHNRPKAFTATGPNEIWCWDITWMPAAAKGHYFYFT
jgi:putative transposase